MQRPAVKRPLKGGNNPCTVSRVGPRPSLCSRASGAYLDPDPSRPFIAEVLSGSTRASILFVYIPEIMVWGVGALFCRELVRRWRAGGVSLLFLGLALSIAEEFIIQQTSLAPLPFPGSHPGYGRIWGITLVYFLFMLGYESVWVVLVPVQVTELFFPQQAGSPGYGSAGPSQLRCIYCWEPHRLVRLDPTGAAPIACGSLSPILGDDRSRITGDSGVDSLGVSRSGLRPPLAR